MTSAKSIHVHVVPCVDYGAGIDFSGLPSINVASHDNISNKILVNLLVNQEPPQIGLGHNGRKTTITTVSVSSVLKFPGSSTAP